MVFVDQQGENIARDYNPNPVQPDTQARRKITGRFSRVTAFWHALTDAQQDAFDRYSIGEKRVDPQTKRTVRPSGWNIYSSYSNVWLQAHKDVGTPPSLPPVGEFKGSMVVIEAVASEGKITFQGSGSTEPGVLVQFDIQFLKRASRKPAKGGYKVADFATLEAGDGNEFSLFVAPGVYAARYAFVEASSGRRTAFTSIRVNGVVLAVEAGGEAAKPSARKKAA